jgi:hypothetical protein
LTAENSSRACTRLLRLRPRWSLGHQRLQSHCPGQWQRDGIEAGLVIAGLVLKRSRECLADHVASRRARRAVGRPRAIAQTSVSVVSVSPLPFVERLAGNPEPPAYACDVSLVARRAQHPQPATLLTGPALPSSSRLHLRPFSLKRRAECVTLVLRFHIQCTVRLVAGNETGCLATSVQFRPIRTALLQPLRLRSGARLQRRACKC